MRQRLFAHLETWRPYTLAYVGLVGLAGAVLAAGATPAWRLAGAWAAPTLGWLAGLYGGDYFDRRLDAVAKPHRPIPSGRMRAGVALAGMIVPVALGTVVALLLNWRSLVLVGGALGLGIAYSTRLKAKGLGGNLARGSVTAIAFLFGAMATAAYPPGRLLPVAAVFWLHDAGSNLVGALRDVDGDRAGGYGTAPVRLGVPAALRWAAALYALWVALAAVAPVVLGRPPGPAFVGLLSLAGALGLVAVLSMVRAPRPLERRVALRAHEIIVLERVVLAGGFIALGGSDGIAVVLTAAALLVTAVAQRTLRDRYEFGAAGAIDAAAVVSYVDTQLAVMSGAARPPAALAGWDRRITISLTDIGLRVALVTRDGTIRRLPDSAGAGGPGSPGDVTVETTTATFRDIFLLGRTNPRRAYLARRIRIDGAPRDLLRLNQVFNQFRRTADAGGAAPVPRMSIVDSRPAGAGGQVGGGEPGRLPGLLVVSDTTLRDGEQMPGVAFSLEQKVDVASRLAALGIPLIEAGFPAVSAAEAEAVCAVVAAGLDADIQVIARPLPADIDAAVATGADSIAIFVGTSGSHIGAKLRTDPARLLRQVADAVGYAKGSGRNVVFAAEDATRADPGFLVEVCQAAQDAGADALGLADTAGVATPWSMQALVRRVTGACALPVAVHCHNDLGLATANSVAALLAGASGVQCSVLGIGERAGNAALEEVLLSLEIAFGHHTGCDLAALAPLAGRIAALLGQPVPPGRPVVGSNAFVHESGLHVDGIIRDPGTYEPYPPELVGRTRRIVFGKHSGRSAVRQAVAGHGLTLDEAQLGLLLDEVKTAGGGPPGLSELDVVLLARSLTTTTGRNQGAS